MLTTRVWRWELTATAISLLVVAPLLALLALSLQAEREIWTHLASTVLNDYVVSTLLLMAGVAVLTLFMGVGCAWLVTQYQFRGVRFFNWALLLPLAMPTYIIAYSYTGLLDIAGPLQSAIRSQFGLRFGEYWFPEIRSLGGAIFVMSFVLYPYVYLLARSAFLDQSQHLKDVGQLLGHSRRSAFFRINLPIARPAIIAGLSLALMETLADYGAVSYFGVQTFTTGIFRTWFGLGSVAGAAQLAMLLLSFVIVLVWVEQRSRRRAQYINKRNQVRPAATPLSGMKNYIAVALAMTPLLIGFVIPVAQLLKWAIATHTQLWQPQFWRLVTNTLMLASVTALLAVALALLIAYSTRIANTHITRLARQLVGLGYAVPGTVIAVGTLIPLARLDNTIDAWFRANFDVSTGLLISGTLAALIIAYLVRFMAVALSSVDSGLQSIGPNMDQAARSLGYTPIQVLRRIHVPILSTSLLTALLVVFVDVMKELPATLVMRPFNFNTLAVRAYELASDERLADASLASLAIILAGLIPVILLTRAINR
ncbi:ABC transporter permease [Arenicella xantha]|uniref:Iron(III) transport system permease protein n=1 Tax=Arenicella xantha TaxID=644221 RepID=A0A395JHS5_9GAMM|nr:iron ABC transporter permease [Arenicella xantha]RBP49636.1 iron(III) transport system permease protein [Arenicella xantha]